MQPVLWLLAADRLPVYPGPADGLERAGWPRGSGAGHVTAFVSPFVDGIGQDLIFRKLQLSFLYVLPS